MSKHLIRFAKRPTSWRPERTDREVQEVEFGDRNGLPDTRPSAFEIDLEQLVQAYAEYSTKLNWAHSTLGINVAGIARDFRPSPAETGFTFTRDAHREIILRDEGELLALINGIRGDLDNRKYEVRKKDVVSYAKGRLSMADPEWLAAVEGAQEKPDCWIAKLAR